MKCLKSDVNSVDVCAEFLKNEKVLILPTDTVYGFSGIVGKTEDRIRNIKGRSENKPFIQLISSKEQISAISDSKIPQKLLDLWPGPLTLIVKLRNSDQTVAVRCPGDEWLRSVIEKAGCPILSTSVNRSGQPVITKIDEICSEFEKETDLIVCDGDSESSVPSTIINCAGEKPEVIREGAVKIDLNNI